MLSLPECLLLAYHQNLDRLRAERSLDAAQAASVPHLTKEGHKSWYKHAQARAARSVVRDMRDDGQSASDGPVFTVNGKSVDQHGLARWLASTFAVAAPPQHAPVDLGAPSELPPVAARRRSQGRVRV